MPASLAEQLRQHRAEMELALALKITPREAAAILRRQARELAREAEAARKANTARCGTHAALPAEELDFGDAEQPRDFRQFGAPWMMRD